MHPTLARFEVAHFGSLSPKYFAKQSLKWLRLYAKYFRGEGRGEGKAAELNPPLPLEFADNL